MEHILVTKRAPYIGYHCEFRDSIQQAVPGPDVLYSSRYYPSCETEVLNRVQSYLEIIVD